ncbi:hypothetical protein, partial [Sphingobacterium faecium]|uniref:hypothetical protein n=1 Tax=Sphingobacterium faecium TaxID=34087 RepID=UPI001D17234F
ILSIIYIAITTISGFLLKNYIPSYFNQKGKNFADKEDIKELTLKVEEVKISFSKEIEFFRAKIDIDKSNHISYYEEEKKALINYHGLMYEWILKIFSTDINRVKMLSYEEIATLRNELDLFPKLSIALSKVRLIIRDEDIVKSSQIFITEVIKYKSEVEKVLMNIQHKIQYKQRLTEMSIRYEPKDFKMELHPEFIRVGKKLDQIIEEINMHCTKYWQEDRIKYFKPIQSIDETYVSKIKKYLTTKTLL